MLLKKGKDDVRAIILACFRIKRCAGLARPSEQAQPPWDRGRSPVRQKSPRCFGPHEEVSPKRPGQFTRHQTIRLPPARRTESVFHVAIRRAAGSCSYVVWLTLVPPEEFFAFEIEFVGVGQQPHLEEKVAGNQRR